MKELGAAICCPERLKKVINFFVVGLTYGCLKSWILMILTPDALHPNSMPRFKVCLVTGKMRLSGSSP